jgi:hypothetical protein
MFITKKNLKRLYNEEAGTAAGEKIKDIMPHCHLAERK